MELLDGETLKQRIDSKTVDLPGLLNIPLDVADALKSAHGAGVLHRDITPANIFITEEGQTKLLDFGLAKLIPPSNDSPSTESGLTGPGMAVGTVAYMAPEQARGKAVDSRSDLFESLRRDLRVVGSCSTLRTGVEPRAPQR